MILHLCSVSLIYEEYSLKKAKIWQSKKNKSTHSIYIIKYLFLIGKKGLKINICIKLYFKKMQSLKCNTQNRLISPINLDL